MTLERLNEHLNIVLELQAAQETLSSLQIQILGATNYDGMPHVHDASRKTEQFAILLQTQIDEVNRLERMVEGSQKDVQEYIDSIEDNRARVIFRLRFLCGLKWDAVAVMLGKGITADAVRSVCIRRLAKENGTDESQPDALDDNRL